MEAQRQEFVFTRCLIDIAEPYKAYVKPLPTGFKQQSFYSEYNWLGNFGFEDSKGNTRKEDFEESYKIYVEKGEDKTALAIWLGGERPEEFTGTEDLDGITYLVATLYAADPPCGWR